MDLSGVAVDLSGVAVDLSGSSMEKPFIIKLSELSEGAPVKSTRLEGGNFGSAGGLRSLCGGSFLETGDHIEFQFSVTCF